MGQEGGVRRQGAFNREPIDHRHEEPGAGRRVAGGHGTLLGQDGEPVLHAMLCLPPDSLICRVGLVGRLRGDERAEDGGPAVPGLLPDAGRCEDVAQAADQAVPGRQRAVLDLVVRRHHLVDGLQDRVLELALGREVVSE
ncbi:hypothetical protein GCM10009791_31390 [Citricoccus zhacaiensis]